VRVRLLWCMSASTRVQRELSPLPLPRFGRGRPKTSSLSTQPSLPRFLPPFPQTQEHREAGTLLRMSASSSSSSSSTASSCPICLGPLPPSNLLTFPCREHKVHRHCALSYIKHCLSTRLVPIPCPAFPFDGFYLKDVQVGKEGGEREGAAVPQPPSFSPSPFLLPSFLWPSFPSGLTTALFLTNAIQSYSTIHNRCTAACQKRRSKSSTRK